MNSEFLPHELRAQLEQRPRLLVVDDQPINIRAIHALFGGDCEVQMATDGATAIRLCETAPPDLVLLDVRMPDLDGYEVCRRLRDAGINQVVPVLFLTSALDQDDELRGFEAGAVDFIRKPIQPVVVRARVATHLSLKLQRDLIRRQAMTDALTGLPNRRQFEQELARQWQQALRHDRTLALLVIDIDYFKQYNDHYGHVAGDACLQQVAQAMQAAMRRPYDLLARYGGEEFVVLLAETTLDGAMQVAQALLTAVAAQAMPHTASLVRPYVSISIGVAAARATPQQSAHDLLHRADQQLYAAKASGRARASAGEVAA